VKNMPHLSATKAKPYPVDWSSCSDKTCTAAELNKPAISNHKPNEDVFC